MHHLFVSLVLYTLHSVFQLAIVPPQLASDEPITLKMVAAIITVRTQS
jgi:hypothetical protein